MLNIFKDNWENPPILNEGERMLRIMGYYDALYVIVDDDVEDVDEAIRAALRAKYGKNYLYEGWKDVSYICEFWERAQADADEAWEDEGWYVIGWSDGGMDWTNNGPVWFESKEDLATEINAAYFDSTDTHVPGAEKVADKLFQEYELDALLGDFKDDYDVEGIIEDATIVCDDGNRYWKKLTEEEMNEILEKWAE